MPYPHVTYQVAQHYERAALESALMRLARELRPVRVRTAGLATFDGNWPVVHVAVEKNEALRTLHHRVWETCLPFARDASNYYHPDSWVPHITLAHGEERNSVPLSGGVVGRLVERLSGGDYQWEVRIDNLALVWGYGETPEPAQVFRLTDAQDDPPTTAE